MKTHAINVSPADQGAPKPSSASKEQHVAKLGILVIDDDHLVRIMVRLGLERDGFEVWLASNGWEAIDLYRKHRDHIALVLLDVCMPELDGPQTLAALRELNPNLPACFMSSDTGNYQVAELHERGAAQLIAKPFRLHDLAAIVRQVALGKPGDVAAIGGHGCS